MEERNLLTMSGSLTALGAIPKHIQCLFRGQIPRLSGPAVEVAVRTVCYRSNGRFALPPGRVEPTAGVTVLRREVANLSLQYPILVEVVKTEFPDYALQVLHSDRALRLTRRAAKIVTARKLVLGEQGINAIHTAMADIYIEAMMAEERHPGILFERFSRIDKQVAHWFVWLVRNAYTTERRRLRGESGGISMVPYELEPRLRHKGGYLSRPLGAEDQLLQHEAWLEGVAKIKSLRVLSPQTQAILKVVGREGLVRAESISGCSKAKIGAAMKEARALLYAQALCRSDLRQLSQRKKDALAVVAQVGLTQAVAQLGRTNAWILQVIREARWQVRAQGLVKQLRKYRVRLRGGKRRAIEFVAEYGQARAAQMLEMKRAGLSEVVRFGEARVEAKRKKVIAR